MAAIKALASSSAWSLPVGRIEVCIGKYAANLKLGPSAIAASSRAAKASVPSLGEQIGRVAALRHLDDLQLEPASCAARAARSIASWPERSASSASTTSGAARPSSAICSCGQRGAHDRHDSRIPAWCSASTSV